MDQNAAIIAQNVSKSFKLPHEKHSGLKQAILHFNSGNKQYDIQHVLQDVSFEIKKGEFFGIVGRNGSGKSTLLKILAGIYQTTEGHISVEGKLVPFIELGVGFNPELTGRENVYLNGALLGFSRKQTEEMYDSIVEFAELQDFMDQKLKNYSSGMQVRLAFSIAIRAKSDILLIDEVLAVGDEAFQRKCLDVFEKYKAEKQTIILVTHDMETVRNFCTRAMLINKGEIVEIGDPRSVSDKYSELNQEKIDEGVAEQNERNAGESAISVSLSSSKGEAKTGFKVGESLIAELSWPGINLDELESIGVNIFKLSGEHITGINSRTGNLPKGWKESRSIDLQFELNLTSGKYRVLVEAFDKNGRLMSSSSEGTLFTVTDRVMEWSGLVEMKHKWLPKETK